MTAKSEMVYGRLLSLDGKGGTDSYKISLHETALEHFTMNSHIL